MSRRRFMIAAGLLALCNSLCATAQELPAQYRSENAREDSTAASALLAKANSLQNSEPDSTIVLAGQAYHLAVKAGFISGAGKALGLMATGYRNIGQYERSIIFFRKALYFIAQQKTNREFMTAAVYNTMVGAYFPRGMYDSAAINCYKVIDIYNKAGGKAIDPPNSPVSPLIDAYQYMGICWLKLGYYQYALRYISKAEELSEANKSHYGLLSILNNKAVTLLAEDRVASARAIVEKGRAMAIRNADGYYQNIFNIDLAVCLRQTGHPSESARALERVLEDTAGIDQETRVNASYQLAVSYCDLKQYNKALLLLLPAIKRAADLGLQYDACNHQKLLSEIYRNMGDIQLAYQHLRIKEALEDSLTINGKAQALNLLDLSLRTADKDRKIAEKLVQINDQKSRIRQQGLWIAIISACTAFTIILLIVFYRGNRHKRRLQEERIQTLRREQELVSLRAFLEGEEKERMRFARELHDGFISQLSAIGMNFSSLTRTDNDNGQLEEYTDQLKEAIGELRKTTQNLVPEILLKGGGLAEAVQVYSERMSKAHGLAIDFQVFGLVPELGAEFALSVYRMIQEGVQNAVKHAGATQVIVQINYSEGVLGITIEDNGRGIILPDEERKGGLGLANMRARANALNGYIHLSGTPDVGTTIYFEFEP